jgi:hypothetical protein
MNIKEEFNKLIHVIETILENKDNISQQQQAAEIANAMLPDSEGIMDKLLETYPELVDLEDIYSDVELSRETYTPVYAFEDLKNKFNEIRQKYS